MTLYAPVPKGAHGPGAGAEAGTDVAVAAWRDRMATAEAQAIYKARAGTAERINADAKCHRTVNRLPVRGLGKVLTWALWVALAQNMMRTMEIVPHLMTRGEGETSGLAVGGRRVARRDDGRPDAPRGHS